MRKDERWLRLRDQLYWERGAKWLRCEIEGCTKFPYELHHCFFHTMKGKEKHLDTMFNLQWVCREHHISVANSRGNELYFWQIQCDRYGNTAMMNWYKSVDITYKERFW